MTLNSEMFLHPCNPLLQVNTLLSKDKNMHTYSRNVLMFFPFFKIKKALG